MDFGAALERAGFRRVHDRPDRGACSYAWAPNRFLTLWVHAYGDGTALLTWEYAVAEYLDERGIQVGDGEVLNLFMYPKQDERGPQDAAWLTAVLDRTEALFGSLDLARPEG